MKTNKGFTKLGAAKVEIERLADHNKLDQFFPSWRTQVLGE